MVSFNTYKRKLVTFNLDLADSQPALILVIRYNLKEAPCFECLLDLKFTRDLKLNAYIRESLHKIPNSCNYALVLQEN